mmetsp:Transcript_4446/g.6903  ORF Transcript_4446/g.6903 Transcript_4446/m.6903 type:complete len:713 (+) Transcript_4446:343-2481(+)|eukprot:CAMPEP_0178928180 /NCGR_PEP_ID=MMETSP0786-20121207/19713_1 /TAXON_ID=186022 /ORGANISM="Thalassionema frauenfeldii, Strain CCMP 1798" /LENGTH=712 /DNA_ID=CAMNT_0020603921 /DNA_START=202 /DNA_END=2340 /DNA_ORIENTATION=-
MGQCGSSQGATNLKDKEADELLGKIQEIASSKGLEGVKNELNLSELYKKGHLHGEDMNLFLLLLSNYCDNNTPIKSVSRSMMIKRDKNGVLKNIQELARRILGKRVITALRVLPILLDPADALQDLANKFRQAIGHDEVREANGDLMKFVKDEFQNWGRTVETKSILTFVPKTKGGICNLVKWAKSKNLRVRAAGFRHSWSDITVNSDSVLISLLPLDQVNTLPVFDLDMHGELQFVELLDKTITEDGVEKRLCKIGSGTTNEQFREWIVKNSLDKKNETWKPWWTLPLNVIMVEITFGGSNGPICHGAGRKTTTLSDLVASIEFVNANGELQTVDDPEQLKSVSGCFGMLGIVTSITMKLDPLTFARMIPQKKRLELTIPPPKGFDIPARFDMSDIKTEMLDEAFEEFVDSCENDYYVEYFWFPNQKRCWINNWKNDGKASDARRYPTPGVVEFQELTTFLSGVTNSTIFRVLPNNFQMTILSTFAMLEMPNQEINDPIVAPVSEALHFRRGIQNMRVNDMEWEIPIPGLKSDPSKPDWSVCQKAWWSVIKAFYDRFDKNKNDVPMRLPLEMRITAGSKVNLAPQFGNDTHGTCSIEILTPENVNKGEWKEYMQEVTDLWTNLKTDDGQPIHPFKNSNGQLLHVRPHWAKEWEGLKVNGKPIKQYLREDAYKDQIPLFREGLAAAAESGGYTLADAEQLFSTKFSREMFGE